MIEQTPTTAGGWFAQAIGTAIFSGIWVIIFGVAGLSLWDSGYLLPAGLLLIASAGGAFCTVWIVIGALIAGAATGTGLMK